jgi:hypothetical protein
MQEKNSVHPSRQTRFFGSFEEAEANDILFYRERSVPDKMQDIADMALAYARNHGVDLDAQGPKRFTQRIQRTRS